MERIVNELNNLGVVAEMNKKNVNGREIDIVTIRKNKEDKLAQAYSAELIAKIVLGVFNENEKNKGQTVELIEKISDENYLKDHILIGLQQKGDNDIVSKDCIFEGACKFVFIDTGESIVKIRKSFLKYSKLTEDELWDIAERNTSDSAKIVQVSEYMLVLTNTNKYFGSGSVCSEKVIKDCKRKLNSEKIIVIPSSIHEIIVYPLEDGDMEIGWLNTINNNIERINRLTNNDNTVLAEKAVVL